MTKHTPGPWSTDNSKSFYVFGAARLSEQAGLEHGPFVCNAATQADARLIAAAPDLLDQLAQCLAVMRDYRTGLIDTSNLEGLEQLEYAGHALIDKIRK
jgi:hypothetical protein